MSFQFQFTQIKEQNKSEKRERKNNFPSYSLTFDS